jgi:hypothetical protein
LIAAFREGLRELGYIERKTILLEVRLAEGAAERLPNSHGSWLRSSQT